MEEEFILTKEEIESDLWKKIERLLKVKLDTSRKANDGRHTEIDTAILRGRISAYKEVLQLNLSNEDI